MAVLAAGRIQTSHALPSGHIGQFLPLHESTSFKDMQSRLKRHWRGDDTPEGEEGSLKQRNLLLQLDSHLEQKLSWFTDTQKNQSPSWVVCFGTLPSDIGSPMAPSDQKQADTARQALLKSMELSRSSLIWIECKPDLFGALINARSSFSAPKHQGSSSDPYPDPTRKYIEFFHDLNGNGKLAASCPMLHGLPSTRRVTMITLDELIREDSNPMCLIDHIFSKPISTSSIMVSEAYQYLKCAIEAYYTLILKVETLQDGLKLFLCDCWPQPEDDFDRVLSRTRACDKDLWGSPDDGPLASSQAPSLAIHGDATKISQKENMGPFSSIPASVAAALPAKPKAPAPPRGPRGPGLLLRAAKDQDQVNPGSKPKVSGSRMPPPAPVAMGRHKQSDRIPKAQVPPRPAPRIVRLLDPQADALMALQAAEK